MLILKCLMTNFIQFPNYKQQFSTIYSHPKILYKNRLNEM
jgi:hypothetical protein